MTTPAPRSTFVTALAWIFISLSGMGALMGIMQIIMFQNVMDSPVLGRAFHATPKDAPVAVLFALNHFKTFLLGSTLLSITTLTASIGLLLRRHWGRLLILAILVLKILWNLCGIFFTYGFMSALTGGIATQENAPDLGPFIVVVTAISAVFSLGFIVLFGWLIKRLMSASVIAEFDAAGSSAAPRQLRSAKIRR